MKKIVYSILLIGAMGFSSCSDILDTPPTTEPSESVFWSSLTDFEAALAACYQGMQEESLSWIMPTYDGLTDNACGSGSSKLYNADLIQADNIDATMTGLVPKIYQEAYSAIARINIFLDKLRKYEGTDISAVRNQMEGEAIFLRSYCYYLLHMFYGEVPYVTEPVTLETQNMPKNTFNEVLTNLLGDLDTAISLMDDKTYKAAGGHATRGAAKALKARVLMFNAYGDNGAVSNTSYMEEAYKLIGEVTGYSLDADYADVFQAAKQESSNEIIFSIKYLAPNSYTQFDNYYGNYGTLSPVQNLADEYEEGDLRKNKVFSTPFTNESGVVVNYYQWEGGDVINLNSSNLKMIKWLRPVMSTSEYWNQTERSEQDIVILRWGELLLLRAEAANELGKPGAADMVNQLRKRAGLANLPDGLTKEEMREAIRHERRVETPYELIRYYDMRRWKIMDKLNGLILGPTYPVGTTKWSKAHEFFPIPQEQIDFSNGVLEQNPNY